MSTTDKDYEKVDSVALQLRIDYNHLKKNLDVFALAKQLNMTLIKYSSLDEEQLNKIKEFSKYLKDGFTVFRKDERGELKFYTFYNDSIGIARIRFTIAHEIKHVVFREKNPTIKEEDMANHFARYILAPPCLVMEYINKGLTQVDIMADFDISYEAATNAYNSAVNRIFYGKSDLAKFEKEFIIEFLSNQKNK